MTLFGFATVRQPFAQIAAPATTVPGATIEFQKDFPGSDPALFSITINEAGEVEYRLDGEEDPLPFQLSAATTERFFELSRSLGNLKEAQLESGRPVAKMGVKTFRYVQGSVRNEAVFNHTDIPAAAELLNQFEQLATTIQHVDKLEYLIRFDRLGIVKRLLAIESGLNDNRLVEPRLLLPVLTKIMKNKSLMNVAHERTGLILRKIEPAAQ